MNSIIFCLEYTYNDYEGNHSFHIGYFSNENNVLRAIESLINKPGFEKNKNGFHYETVDVICRRNKQDETKNDYFELSYEEECGDGYDYTELMGIYSCYDDAQEEKTRLLNEHESRYKPDGFMIENCLIDIIGWSEGFVPW